jgi:predicted nucleic acid-binding Zn ribbon protein
VRPLGGAIGRALRAFGLAAEVARADAVQAWPAVAGRVIGADADRTRAVRVEERTLVVAVPTAQWAAEIRLRERDLVSALRDAAPGSGIARIRSVPSETVHGPSARGPAGGAA